MVFYFAASDPLLFRESVAGALGNMLEAFLSPQPEVVTRDFSHLNRTFVTKASAPIHERQYTCLTDTGTLLITDQSTRP